MTNISDTTLGCFAQGVEGDMTACVVDGVFAAGPAPGVMGLLLGGTVLTSLYVAGNGSIVVPGIVTILFSGLLVAVVPPQFELFAYSVAFLGIAAATLGAWVNYTSRGGI